MQRFSGQDLGSNPHIAVLGSSKIGNFVVTIPLLKALSLKYPDSVIDFWGSELTKDFECALPFISWRMSWDLDSSSKLDDLAIAYSQRLNDAGPFDLVVNCDGFNPVTQVLSSLLRPRYAAGSVLSDNLRSELPLGNHPNQLFLADKDWDSQAFLQRYSNHFNSNYIAELLCRLAFVDPPNEPPLLPSQLPSFSVPDILIHVTTTRSAKLWPGHCWKDVLDWCEFNGLSVGLIGSPPKLQREAYNSGDIEHYLLSSSPLIDLRGKTSLIELAGACTQAKAVLSVDAGPMHIAAGVGTPTLAIVGNDVDGVGASPIRLWMPRTQNCSRTISTITCDGCSSARFKNDGCLKENHICMEGVTPSQVTHWLENQLNFSN